MRRIFQSWCVREPLAVPAMRRRLLGTVLANVVIGSAYWGLAVVVFRYFSRYQMWPAPIWFPAGVSMFAAYSVGFWSWPGIFIGSLLTNTVTFREPLVSGTIISLGNTIAPVLAVSLIRSEIRTSNPLARVVHVGRFSLACILHGMTSAAIGATAVWVKDGGPARDWLSRWLEWATSDTGASLLMVPLFLFIRYKVVSLERIRKHATEFAATACASAATVAYLLSRTRALPAADAGVTFLMLLPLLWMSVRFSARIAYPIFGLIIMSLIVATLAGLGPYAGVDGGRTFIIFAQMVIGFGIAVLLLGATSEEQREAGKALRQLNRDLERIVESRTAELRESKLRLEQAAFHDSLTGLPNRRLLEERFAGCRAAAGRKGAQLALLLIDLDFFKQVNDDFGHDAGDAVLVEAGRRLSSVVREYDLVARLGGDEFAVLLPELGDKQCVTSVCFRIVRELSKPIYYHGRQVLITPSVGVAVFPDHGDSWTLIYRAADRALYGAKRNGRARWAWHVPGELVPEVR